MRYTSSLLVAALGLQVVACDDGAQSAAPGDLLSPTVPSHSAAFVWASAENIDPSGASQVNTAALEGCPNESPDGRALFFASDRSGSLDIWVTYRQSGGEWGTPEQLPAPVNTGAAEFCPTALPGGGLLFVSTRSDGSNCGVGTADIYETRFIPPHQWADPEHLGCVINSAANEFSPSYVSAGGGMLFFSSDRGGKQELYVSLRGPGGVWGTPVPIVSLNLAGFNTARPNVSQDGREIVFDSDRPGLGGYDIYYAQRSTPLASWSAPVNAGEGVNSTSNETRASLSRDGKRLYFGSNRVPSSGNFDIYVAKR